MPGKCSKECSVSRSAASKEELPKALDIPLAEARSEIPEEADVDEVDTQADLPIDDLHAERCGGDTRAAWGHVRPSSIKHASLFPCMYFEKHKVPP